MLSQNVASNIRLNNVPTKLAVSKSLHARGPLELNDASYGFIFDFLEHLTQAFTRCILRPLLNQFSRAVERSNVLCSKRW